MKILIDLNIEKKITMIMVTHDVGLKTFANRVIRMADGKVNRIQEIDVEARNETIRHLNDRVNAIQRGLHKDALSIREGIALQDDERQDEDPNKHVVIPQNFTSLNNITTTKTSVRKPTDYPVLRGRSKK